MTRLAFSSLLVLLLTATLNAQGPKESNPIEGRIKSIIARMTLEEKVSLQGGTGFDTRPMPQYGVPSLRMTDGPVGIRTGRATAFPASIAMAATWDTALIRTLGAALGREAKAKNKNVLLGPCVNIHRVPHGGRNFESFGEDPLLAARMSVAYILGVQSQGVAATVKHFAVNNQEHERMFVDAQVSERALREIYLPSFEASVREAGVLAVMNAYNRLNGPYCTENVHVNIDILKNEWGFTGLLMSDWGATHSVAPAANGGLDLEMPVGDHFGDSLVAAVRNGTVAMSAIDDHVARILRLALHEGLYQGSPKADTTVLTGPLHRQINLQVAREGIVLLKNDQGLLPLDRSKLKSLAIIGPNANVLRAGGGGSSMVNPTSSLSPLEAVRRAAPGLNIMYAQGVSLEGDLTPIDPSLLTPGGKLQGKGWRAEYFANMELKGKPAVTRVEPAVNFDWGGDGPGAGIPDDRFSARWTATLRPDSSAVRRLEVSSDDGIRLWIDDKLLIDDWADHAEIFHKIDVELVQGKEYELKLEYYENAGSAVARCGWLVNQSGLVSTAADVARKADAAVLFIGLSSRYESEGFDRPTLSLPEDQLELITAVTEANPKTIIVLNSGAPILMEDWVDRVASLLEAWYPGQEGGNAIAEILFGDVTPSGKLPSSFLRQWEDYSSFPFYPGTSGVAEYKDDIFVGYRHADRTGVEPTFAFGHGLSYTTFAYENLQVRQLSGLPEPSMEVSFDLVNTGTRQGTEIAQVYVSNPAGAVERPRQELRGFSRIELQPAERQKVVVKLNSRAFSYYNVAATRWEVPAGDYGIRVGSSSRAIQLAQIISIR